MFTKIAQHLESVFQNLPIRLARVGRHLSAINKLPFAQYVYELLILWVEIIGIGEIYETMNAVFKPNIRGLTVREIAEAQLVFGENIKYSRILIDEKARIGCKNGNFAYVSFYIVNHWGSITDAHLIHELAHIWQYECLGARYMLRAIQAQRSAAGYNYGGIEALKNTKLKGIEALKTFNMEQQAEIFTDYYRLLKGRKPQYGNATAADLPYYKMLISPHNL